MQLKHQLSLLVTFGGVSFRFPGATVPKHDRATAIFAGGDGSLERTVFERMIFNVNGQRFLPSIETRSFGNRPALENAVSSSRKS